MTLTVPLFWIFISSDASICFTMASPSLGNSDHVVVSVSINFLLNSKWDAPFHCVAYTILMLFKMIFVIIWEMFRGMISLNLVLLLLLVNVRSSITYLHGFQLPLLLP